VNPLMWLNPGRWLIVIAAVASLAIGLMVWEQKVEQGGYDRAMADVAKVTAVAAQKARETEQANAQRQKEAQDAQEKRTQTLQSALAELRIERDSLRDDLDARSRGLPQDSGAACTQYASTLSGLLNQCAAGLESMAGKAQGHVNDIKVMVESWPKN